MTAQDILNVLHEIKNAPAATAAQYEAYRRRKPDGFLTIKHMPGWERWQRAEKALHQLLLHMPLHAEDLDPLPKASIISRRATERPDRVPPEPRHANQQERTMKVKVPAGISSGSIMFSDGITMSLTPGAEVELSDENAATLLGFEQVPPPGDAG